jgi:Protein of unknown function (DUF998)
MDQQSGPQDSLVLSYLTLRQAVGIIGCALPFVLAFGNILLQRRLFIECSISDYYYTEVGGVFVGGLCAIGVFLFSVRGYDRRDEIAGRLACLFAVGVALFPTNPCAGGNSVIGYLHLTFATLLFLTLAYFSLGLFTETDPNKTPTRQKLQRNIIYRVCGWTILACILLIAVIKLTALKNLLDPLDPIFWLESIAVVSFGFSWLTKGETILKDEEA